jgi:2-iminobutanoate/2-iminopropanoate deaminase
MKIIETPHAPAPIGPYSQAIALGNLLFCSGQIAIDPASGEFQNVDVDKQTEIVFSNIKAVLTQAGTDLSKVVKTTIFLTTMNHFGQVNEIYAKHFGTHKPARSTVAVAELPKKALVEIEVVAQI